jgi:RNA-directed DNA polymerase
VPRCRLGPSDRLIAWIPFVPCSACCTAVPSKIRNVGFMRSGTKVARSDVMWRAWCDVAANRGAPGVDGVSIADIDAGGVESVRAFLDELAETIRSGSYRPAPLRRVHIPKPGRLGQTRPLGIPTVGDRIVMTAAKIVLEPVFEADFDPVSFGFRPKRSAQQALETVRVAGNQGRVWVLDADIKACLDASSHCSFR